MNTLSAEAIALAVKLSGHTQCQRSAVGNPTGQICDGCLGDAATIDAELALPARTAVLLLAQQVIDAHDKEPWAKPSAVLRAIPIDELREALARIKAP